MDWNRKILEQTAFLPTSVQDRLAADISGIYRTAWEAAGSPLGSPQDYFDANPLERQAVRQAAADKFVPWARNYGLGIAPTLQGNLEVPRALSGAYRQTAEDVRGIGQTGTVGQLEEILARSTYGAHEALYRTRGQMSGFGTTQGVASSAVDAYLGVADRLPSFNFDPKREGNFMAFAVQRAGMGATSEIERKELAARPLGTQSYMEGDEMSFGAYGTSLEAIAAAQEGGLRSGAFAVRSGDPEWGWTIVRKYSQGFDNWGPQWGHSLSITEKTRVPTPEFNQDMAADAAYSRQRTAAQEAYATAFDQRYSTAQVEILQKQRDIRQSSARYFPMPVAGSGSMIVAQSQGAGTRYYANAATGTIDPFGPNRQMALTADDLYRFSRPGPAERAQLAALDQSYRTSVLYNAPAAPGVIDPSKEHASVGKDFQIQHGQFFQGELPSGHTGYFSAVGRPRGGTLRYRYLGDFDAVQLPSRYWDSLPSKAIPAASRMYVQSFQGLGFNLEENRGEDAWLDVERSYLDLPGGGMYADPEPPKWGPYPSVEMNMSYGNNARQGVRAATTYQAGLSGERTQTTRWGPAGYEQLEGLREGSLFWQVSAGDEKALMQATGDVRSFNLQQMLNDPNSLEAWSQAEGWSIEGGRKMMQDALKRGLKTGYSLSYRSAADHPANKEQPRSPWGQDVGEDNVAHLAPEDEIRPVYDEMAALQGASVGYQDPRYYQQTVGEVIARNKPISVARRLMDWRAEKYRQATNAAGYHALENAKPAPPNLAYWRNRIARSRSRNAPGAAVRGGTRADSVTAAMAIPEEMLPEATKAAQYWTEVASWMAGRDIQVKPYTGQFQKSGSRVVPAFYRYDDDTIYMAKQFFDEGEWTPERLKNIGGDLTFKDLGGRFISHEVGHAELTQEGHETILRAIKGSSPRQRDRRKAYMAGLPGGDMSDEQLASEVGAEIRSEGFGYSSPMVEAVLGGQKHSVISKVLGSTGTKYADRVREARRNAQANFPGGFDDLEEPEFDSINFGDLPSSEDMGSESAANIGGFGGNGNGRWGGPPPPEDPPWEEGYTEGPPDDPNSNSARAGLRGGAKAMQDYQAGLSATKYGSRKLREWSDRRAGRKSTDPLAIHAGQSRERHQRVSDMLGQEGRFERWAAASHTPITSVKQKAQAKAFYEQAGMEPIRRAGNAPFSVAANADEIATGLPMMFDSEEDRQAMAEMILSERTGEIAARAEAAGYSVEEYTQHIVNGTLPPLRERRPPNSLSAAQVSQEGARASMLGSFSGGLKRAESQSMGVLHGDRNARPGRGAQAAFVDPKTGEINLSAQGIETAREGFNRAVMDAFQGPLPDDPRAMLMTLQERISKGLKKWVNDLEKSLVETSDSPSTRAEASELKARIDKVTRSAMNAGLSRLESELEGKGLETEGWRDQITTRLSGEKHIQAAGIANPALGEQILGRFGSYAAAARAQPTVLTQDDKYYMVGDLGFDLGGVGGEGGFGQHGPRGARGIMGQGAGQLLYGAYLTKRMLAMTVGPSIQEAEYYAGKVMEPSQYVAAGVGGAGAMSGSAAGVATRSEMLKNTFAEGAYQQWGGITNATYALMAGNVGAARALSGIGAGLGIAGIGAMAPQLLGMMGLGGGALATAAGSVLPAVGLTIAGGSLGMEGYNRYFRPEGAPEISWGWMAETGVNMLDVGAARTQYYQQALRQGPGAGKSGLLDFLADNLSAPLAGFSTMFSQAGPESGLLAKALGGGSSLMRNLFGALGIAAPGEEAVLAQMTPAQRDLYRMQTEGPSEQMVQAKTLADRMLGITGESISSSMPAFREMTRYAGTIDGNKIADSFYEGWQRFGLTGMEQAQRYATVAQQLGYRYGEGGALLNQFTGMTEDQRIAYEERAGQVARYGGAFAGYFTDAKAGQRLADRYDIRTQVQATGIQQLFQAGTITGMTGDQIGDTVAQLGQKYGPYKSGLAAQLAQTLIPMGVDPLQALGAFGALGAKGETDLQSMQAFLGQAKMFGSQVNPMDISAAALRQNAWQTQTIGGLAQQMAIMGNVDIGVAQQGLSGLGFSNRQMYMANRIAGGDLSAWSWNARQTGSAYGAFLNDAGMPIYQTDMRQFEAMLRSQAASGNPYAASGAAELNQMLTGLWSSDREAYDAYMAAGPTGGAIGRSLLHAQRMRGFQMRQLDLSQEQADAGWAHEQAGWALTDRQRQMQYRFQMRDFAVQGQRITAEAGFAERSEGLQLQRMNMQQVFAVRSEGLQWQQMQAGWRYAEQGENLSYSRLMANNQFAVQGENLAWKRIELQEQFGGQVAQLGRERMLAYHQNQLWGLQFSYGTEQMQRGFTEENWAAQDTQRSLQRGWQTEDLNEAIRFASGRQRAQLVRQRERQNIMSSLEEEDVERGRSQQEQLWEREDERYANQEQFLNRIIELDKQQYELAEEQREASIALEKEEWDLSKQRRESNLDYELQEWEMGKSRRLELMEIDKKQFDLQVEQRKAYFQIDLEGHNLSVERRKYFYELDQRELERRISEYQKQYALQSDMIQFERDWQKQQRQFQLESLQLQRDQLKETQAYEIEMEKVQRIYQATTGYFNEMVKNDPTTILKAISEVARDMGSVSPTTVDAIQRMLKAINGVDQSSLQQLMDVLITMES
jgi:hypothetical protein